ncbi:hypothetical protein PFFCH_01920 [Plasmodium falciparum FCH/4]|uniref:Uncharacterized protein n=1 Tax=Plasmodium falciparum FCH/4 TaxID=1036724 RepID=A0A024VQP4_PLAFA|nr:hypothetical protein PFFCH_01920 [Plasmodium falciparum FCH/4]
MIRSSYEKEGEKEKNNKKKKRNEFFFFFFVYVGINMKKAIFFIYLIFFVFVKVTCLEIRRGKYNINYDYAIKSLKDNNFKRRGAEKGRRNNIYYMNINFHNIDNNFNNEIRKRHFNENDSIKDKLNKLKKLKNILNKYKLNINKKDFDKFKNRTQEIVVHKYHYAKKYSIIIFNRLKDDMSVYRGKLKNYYNTTTTYLKDKYFNSSIHEYLSSIPFFNKSSNISKLISYNSVNFLFLLIYFILFYFIFFFSFCLYFFASSGKILGGLVLLQLFLIYARLIFQNNLSFIKTWTDEKFFNKEEIIQNIKDDKKTDFYVKLLNQYDFLKRLYVGNNKIYEICESRGTGEKKPQGTLNIWKMEICTTYFFIPIFIT